MTRRYGRSKVKANPKPEQKQKQKPKPKQPVKAKAEPKQKPKATPVPAPKPPATPPPSPPSPVSNSLPRMPEPGAAPLIPSPPPIQTPPSASATPTKTTTPSASRRICQIWAPLTFPAAPDACVRHTQSRFFRTSECGPVEIQTRYSDESTLLEINVVGKGTSWDTCAVTLNLDQPLFDTCMVKGAKPERTGFSSSKDGQFMCVWGPGDLTFKIQGYRDEGGVGSGSDFNIEEVEGERKRKIACVN